MIGVFGGTFDPIHFGHLRTAYEFHHRLRLSKTLLIPSREPPHRAAPRASVEQRWTMLRLAVAGVAEFEARDLEITRDGPSYTIDTLLGIRAEVGDRPICLLIGADSFLALPSWHRWRELFNHAHVVVAARPGVSCVPGSELAAEVDSRWIEKVAVLHRSPAGHVMTIEFTQLDISASALRTNARDGLSIRFLTPDSVAEFVERQGLYR